METPTIDRILEKAKSVKKIERSPGRISVTFGHSYFMTKPMCEILWFGACKEIRSSGNVMTIILKEGK